MTNPSLERQTQRARMLTKIIALADLTTNNPEEGPEAKGIFWKALKRTVGILRDMDSTPSSSIDEASTFSPTIMFDIRTNFRSRLLGNISALGELIEMSQISPVTKSIFWEAIKLELKTLRDLEEDPPEAREEASLSAFSSASRVATERIDTGATTYRQTKVPATDHDGCAATQYTHSHSSPSMGDCLPSPPGHNGNFWKRAGNRDHRRKRSRFLPSILSPASPRTEWLRPKHSTVQETAVMEMIFYKTSTMRRDNPSI